MQSMAYVHVDAQHSYILQFLHSTSFIYMYWHACNSIIFLTQACSTMSCILLVVGASLSKPHTSVTSLPPCMCMFACLLAWTDHLP